MKIEEHVGHMILSTAIESGISYWARTAGPVERADCDGPVGWAYTAITVDGRVVYG